VVPIITDARALGEIHNDLMFLSLGVSCILVMLWSLAKRVDDLEMALVKVLTKITGSTT
jgi:hypothetical protein